MCTDVILIGLQNRKRGGLFLIMVKLAETLIKCTALLPLVGNGYGYAQLGKSKYKPIKLQQMNERDANLAEPLNPQLGMSRCYTQPFRILNLYAGIGGNRTKWGNEYQITAVEFNPKIADKYKQLYPNDTVIVADAHQYLLDHYKEFDFIWTSPPCQTHSRANYFINYITESRYPKMELWQEIIFLKTFCKTKFCVENVISYYEYFIKPTAEIGRHYLWANFTIPKIELPKGEVGTMMKQYVGTGKHAHDKQLEERNCVNADLGLHILNRALEINKQNNAIQTGLFADVF